MRALLLLAALALPAAAEPVRVASYNASLSRDAPGILLRDLMAGEDQAMAVLDVVARVRPDILLLNEVDYDAGGEAAAALRAALAERGLDYPHHFLAPSNTGMPSGLDLDGDGETTGPNDAWGFGFFPGQYAMLLLSRFPVDAEASATFRLMPWQALPGAELPRRADGTPFPSAEVQPRLRLSSKSHWDVAVETPEGRLRILASHPTPPVFDGPEDRNGLRNRDEIRFWQLYLDGATLPADDGRDWRWDGAPVVVAGDLNADPEDGDGRLEAVRALLAHPALQDPEPTSAGGPAAAAAQGGANADHAGDPALDTADWNDERGPGNLRVDYVLPGAALTVRDAGVYWPRPGEAGADLAAASDHRLVWVDVELP